ncbi:hypothetical protein ACHQM5_009386 [Ranunculus cassubicifolius]
MFITAEITAPRSWLNTNSHSRTWAKIETWRNFGAQKSPPTTKDSCNYPSPITTKPIRSNCNFLELQYSCLRCLLHRLLLIVSSPICSIEAFKAEEVSDIVWVANLATFEDCRQNTSESNRLRLSGGHWILVIIDMFRIDETVSVGLKNDQTQL